MKSFKTIKQEIKKNFSNIEAMQAEIKKLDFSEEKHEAAQRCRFNSPELSALYEKARQNAGKIAELSNKIFVAEVKTRILQANARAALLNEALPVIIEACKPYAGKPYGEKTAAKIKDEVKKAGFGFYFDGYHNNRINIYTLTNEGYRGWDETTGAGRDENGQTAYFLTEDNKININSVFSIVPFADKYEENPGKAAATVAKALKNYMKATKALEKQRAELIHMMPAGIPEPDYIKEYYIHF